MSWEPTLLEKMYLAMQPEPEGIIGQLMFEEKEKKYFKPPSNPNPISDPEPHLSRGQIMLAKIRMMDKIQKIAGTKPYGHHASLADWDDKTDIIAESQAMLRYFEKSDVETSYPVTVPTTGIIWSRKRNRIFPILLDPKFIEPGTTFEDRVDLLNYFIALNPPPLDFVGQFDSCGFIASHLDPNFED